MSRPSDKDASHYADLYERGLINPWMVRDGKWGGLGGDQCWVRAQTYGFAKGDVVEWERIKGGNGTCHWFRVWIDADQAWRELTADEVARLPEMN